MSNGKIFFIFLTALFFAACSRGNTAGVYEGNIPLPNGKTMEIELTLNPDQTFILTTIYPDDLASSYKETGSYAISEKKFITLRYYGDGIKFLKKDKDGSLNVLTVTRKEIKGPLKDSYKLKKKSNLLF